MSHGVPCKVHVIITGIACIPAIPVIFEVNTLCGLLIYTLNYFIFSNFLIIFTGIACIPAIPVIITCTLQGTICDTGFPRTFYGGKICSVGVIVYFHFSRYFVLDCTKCLLQPSGQSQPKKI